MAIQAIETYYNGYRFRSRLEARWAVFFDTMGIEWRYETEGYILEPISFPGISAFMERHKGQGDPATLRRIATRIEKDSASTICYLPDFWLPSFQMYVEVKGDLTMESIDKVFRLSNQAGVGILLLQEPEKVFTVLGPNNDSHSDIIGDVNSTSFRRCPICKGWALRAEPCDCVECRKQGLVSYYCLNCAAQGKKNLRVKRSMEWEPIGQTEVDKAIIAARSARFEHGETPKVARGKPRK